MSTKTKVLELLGVPVDSNPLQKIESYDDKGGFDYFQDMISTTVGDLGKLEKIDSGAFDETDNSDKNKLFHAVVDLQKAAGAVLKQLKTMDLL